MSNTPDDDDDDDTATLTPSPLSPLSPNSTSCVRLWDALGRAIKDELMGTRGALESARRELRRVRTTHAAKEKAWDVERKQLQGEVKRLKERLREARRPKENEEPGVGSYVRFCAPTRTQRRPRRMKKALRPRQPGSDPLSPRLKLHKTEGRARFVEEVDQTSQTTNEECSPRESAALVPIDSSFLEEEETGEGDEETPSHEEVEGDASELAKQAEANGFMLFRRYESRTAPPPGGYKYVEVVRNKEERSRLPAHDCKECRKFDQTVDPTGTVYDRTAIRNACSRHRAQFSPSRTPPGFWKISFTETETQEV